MTIDTKRLRELAESATVENCQRAGENPGAMLQRFYEAFTRDTALALLDEIERLHTAIEGTDSYEYWSLIGVNEALKEQLAAMTAARNELADIAQQSTHAIHFKDERVRRHARIAELRKVGQ